MKKIILMAMVCLCAMQAMASDKPSFIGKRSFNFGGVPAWHEGYELTMQKGGNMLLTKQGCSTVGGCMPKKTLHKGKFKQLVRVNDEGHVYYIRLGKNQAYMLDANKKQEYGCNPATINNDPCIGKYYRE